MSVFAIPILTDRPALAPPVEKRKHTASKDHHHGFTLIEVMVALLVLALALTALQFRITQHVNNSTYLRDKTVAGWVAQNHLELERLESQQRNRVIPEIRSGTDVMAGKQWYWQIIPQPVPAQLGEESRILPLLITVADNDSPDTPLVSLTGVIDAWHRMQ